MPLTETVTVTRPVPQAIQDLVYFAKRLAERHGVDLKGLTDEQLVKIAHDYWEAAHGEDD